MRWFIADTHFNHTNVISYDNRPFRDTKHMEDEIVSKWNNTVRADDIVYHLGDFGFGPLEVQKAILGRLNGTKILIRGNHDGGQARNERMGWNFVCDGMLINLSGIDIWLVHDPSRMPTFCSLVHGHTHKHSDRPNSLCVSCNLHNYLPVSEKLVIKHLNRSIQ